MKIAVLTSSRADFGIYLPLLKALKKDDFFELKTIVFGTHLSNYHGYTKDQIEASGIEVNYEIDSMMLSDTKEAISTAMGLTMVKFAQFWTRHESDFDVVLCLGDRFEMFAAVLSGLPFSIKFAHLHGGEKTLGAIDNVFRHALSHASQVHFTSTEGHKRRVEELIDVANNVHNVGALSLDNILELNLLNVVEFEEKWGINIGKTTALVTFHPETVKAEMNATFADEIVKVILKHKEIQFLITMPNADTAGSIIRNIFINELSNAENVFMKENLGVQSYFSAMKHCKFLLGNTSSGIIEAASFDKYVINLGARQEGRSCGSNIIQTALVESEMDTAIQKVMSLPAYSEGNLYYKGGAADSIVSVLKGLT
ncbi:MAG: GDP/UDP-N,N'-diacetylbacillosamine 2-epimerase (hydrolyzing) [Glaciecola sp.]|jgi:GDP/UDP-N,N'-diacetylbacillosamine 2-epimerase (hydrolysing)